MKRMLFVLLSGLMTSGCFHSPQWYGMLFLQNDTDHSLLLTTNIVCSRLGDVHQYSIKPNHNVCDTLEIEPGSNIVLAKSKWFTDKSSIVIEELVDNLDDAFVTVSSVIDGDIVSYTWRSIDRNKAEDSIFDLNDCDIEINNDKWMWNICYAFMITENELRPAGKDL